jgi:energy-coupling factor transporter ATP-binding protein EcfA2
MPRLLKKPWHEVFFECVSPYTDAPDSFIVWSALSLIGATLKNKTCFEMGTYTVYPNLYVILVAPPGVGKGTALHIIDDLINETKPNKVINTIKYRNTTESILIDIFNGWQTPLSFVNQQIVVGKPDHSCLCLSTEIRTLLGSSDWMLEFLEEAWSETTYESKTKNKGAVDINEMCFSLLAASVPDFLRQVGREYSSKMVITGGFSARCLFIYAEKASKDLSLDTPFLKSNAKSKATYDMLINDLRDMAQVQGKFVADTAAKIMCETFLKKNRLAIEKEDSEVVANARARAKANVVKLAMVFSASRGNSMTINQIDMFNAIAAVEGVIDNLSRLFRGAGENVDGAACARVEDFIERVGKVSRKELLRGLHRHMSAETLDRILTVLETIGFVTISTANHQAYYQSTGKKGRTTP